jgi:betaine-aldehyde dehydrogenase
MPARGFFVPPTIFLNPSPSSRAWREEIFGPVLCVIEFTSEEDAVEKANATVYGLAGAVFSADPQRCERVAKALRVGVMWLNCSQPAFPGVGAKAAGSDAS